MLPPSQRWIEEENLKRALPGVGQLDDRLGLSPQRVPGHKAIEIKRLFPRAHGIHGAAQLMGEHGQGYGFAVLALEFGAILFAGLTLAEEEHGGFGKRPA